MKKLFFLALLCASGMVAKAQYKNFGVANNTTCTVYAVFYGSTSGCNNNYRSDVKTIPAMSAMGFTDPSLVPGGMNNGLGGTLTASGFFTEVRIYNDDPTVTPVPCPPIASFDMSDCIPGGSTFEPVFDIDPDPVNSCLPNCPGKSLTWHVGSPVAAWVSVD